MFFYETIYGTTKFEFYKFTSTKESSAFLEVVKTHITLTQNSGQFTILTLSKQVDLNKGTIKSDRDLTKNNCTRVILIQAKKCSGRVLCTVFGTIPSAGPPSLIKFHLIDNKIC